MTAFVLTLHLLGAPAPAPNLHLMPRVEHMLLAQNDVIPVAPPPEHLTLTPPPAAPVHDLGREFLFGFGAPFAVLGIVTAASVPFAFIALIGALAESAGLLTAGVVGLLILATIDVFGAPFASTYGVAHVHGDRSGGALVAGYLGGLLGEFLGAIPAGLVLAVAGGTNNGVVDIVVLIAALALDAAAIAGGSMAFYHLAAGPVAVQTTVTPGTPSVPEPPPSYSPPPTYAPPPPYSPPMMPPPPPSAKLLSFAF